MNQTRITRRDLIARAVSAAAAGVVAPMVVAPSVLGRQNAVAPNDRIRIGYIGVGRRSRQLMKLPDDAVVTAYADVNRARLREMKARNTDANVFEDYRDMLASDTVDAVVIATPDHWHALHTVHACQAGKDVYIEKPLSLTVRDGRAIVDAAQKLGRIVQTGSQQRSLPACMKGCADIQSGRIGKVHTVHGANYPSPWDCDLGEEPLPDGLNWDMWCGPTVPRPYHKDLYLPRAEGRTYPDGRPLGWISYRPYSGGEMTGWGAHGLDIVLWALGLSESGPVEVWPEDSAPEAIVYFGKTTTPTPGMEPLIRPVTMRFADGTLLKLDGKGPGGGALFEGDDGVALVDRGKYVLKHGDKTETLEDKAVNNDTFDHMTNWLACIRSREQPRAGADKGHRAATICHLGNIARWTGRKLAWDPANETFVNDAEANALLERPMRAPWTL